MVRGKDEGSICRRADGYWVGAVEAGRGPNGKRRRAGGGRDDPPQPGRACHHRPVPHRQGRRRAHRRRSQGRPHRRRGDELEALWWLALQYGLRQGELLALRWSDVDLDGGELHVRKAKTTAGIRSLPLIPEAARRLRRHRQRAKVVGPGGLVFPAPRGDRRSPQRLRLRWSDLPAGAGIEHRRRSRGTEQTCSTSIRRFHSSRHTAATLLLENGVALEVVSAILGHSSITVTASIYAKVRADLKRRGLEAGLANA